jgi:MFS family permease
MTRTHRAATTYARISLALIGSVPVSPDVLSAQRQTAVAVRRSHVDERSRHTAARAANARIAAQIGGSALAAAVLGFVAWQLLDDPDGSDRRVKGDAGYTPNANTAFAVGSFVGSAVAGYWIGRGDGSRGSLAATALGAALATIPLAVGRHEPYLPIIGIVFGAPLQGVGATLGYQLTRR